MDKIMNEKIKNYDKFTLGKSPAAVYLIDLLNQSTNAMDSKVIFKLQTFQAVFKQLVEAYEKKVIDKKVVFLFSNYKRVEINQHYEEMVASGMTPLVVNLYRNLVIAELKKFERKCTKVFQIEKSATDRAKALLRNKGTKGREALANKQLLTYAKFEGEKVAVEVNFNSHGLPVLQFDKTLVKDSVTSESLMEKSTARLKRLGKIPYQNI